MRDRKSVNGETEPPVGPTILEVTSLVDALYMEIRERILTGVLPGGSAITEMDLATMYSVARPTAKASMERLVQEGLLRRGSHKTAKVTVLDTDDIRDLYFNRALLEREVMMSLAERRYVPEAARRSYQQLGDVKDTNPSPMDVANLDIAFHSALVDGLGSPRLNRLYRSLVAEVRLCMAQLQANHLLAPSRIAEEHSMIIARIDEGDVEGVVAAINGHIDRAGSRLIDHVESAAAGTGSARP
jgi:DNA-binding GntR family transcriptional regulator